MCALAHTLVCGSVPKKTLADLEHNPKDVSYEELLAVLRDHGCEIREGTKHGAIANRGGLTLTVPRPHKGKTVKAIYVREPVRLVKGERK